MTSENKDILFSSLGGIEVKADERVEQSYLNFAKVFNRISSAISELIESESENIVKSEGINESKGIESSIAQILRGVNEEGDRELYEIEELYYSFLDAFNSFLEDNEILHTELTNRGLNLEELYNPRYPRYRRFLYIDEYEDDMILSTYGLQFVGCSYLIVDRLWDVYRCFTSKSNFLEFAYDGSNLLSYTWKDYLRTLSYIHETPYLFIQAVLSFTTGIPVIGKKTTKKFSHLERVGAAFADFPYKFKHNGIVKISSSPITKTTNSRIKSIYLRDEMKLDLKDEHGLSVALFDYKFNKRTLRCVSFAGTRIGVTSYRKWNVMVQNTLTDIFQYFNVPSTTYLFSVGLLNDIIQSYPKGGLYVFGHSLGGGLMQFSCAALNRKRLYGYGYNSAGLSDNSMKIILGNCRKKLQCKVVHICSLHDPVSRLGHQIGEKKYVKSRRGIGAHCLAQLNKKLNNTTELQVFYK